MRTSRSTGGQPRVYIAPSSAAAVGGLPSLLLLGVTLLLLLPPAAGWAAKLSSARCSSSDALRAEKDKCQGGAQLAAVEKMASDSSVSIASATGAQAILAVPAGCKLCSFLTPLCTTKANCLRV